jgi:hypothetical protein
MPLSHFQRWKLIIRVLYKSILERVYKTAMKRVNATAATSDLSSWPVGPTK